MVLTAYFVLSPATNSSCHRHPRIKGSSNPVGLDFASASLAPATGVRTTRLHRPQHRRSSARRSSLTELIPPCQSIARPALPRPPHPAPNVYDDRETPLRG